MHVWDDLYVGVVVGLILATEHLFKSDSGADHGAFNTFLIWLVICFKTGFNGTDLIFLVVCSILSFVFGLYSLAVIQKVLRKVNDLLPEEWSWNGNESGQSEGSNNPIEELEMSQVVTAVRESSSQNHLKVIDKEGNLESSRKIDQLQHCESAVTQRISRRVVDTLQEERNGNNSSGSKSVQELAQKTAVGQSSSKIESGSVEPTEKMTLTQQNKSIIRYLKSPKERQSP